MTMMHPFYAYHPYAMAGYAQVAPFATTWKQPPVPLVDAESKISPYAGWKTPGGTTDNFESLVLTSARKSVFDNSPMSLGGLGLHLESSPSGKSIVGMSPPMTNLKDTFDSPGKILSTFSPDTTEKLNKTLFSEAMSTPFPQTPKTPDLPPIQIFIGDTKESTDVNDMRLCNRVSISPMLQSQDDAMVMPPPTAQRVRDAPRISSSALKVHTMMDFDAGTPIPISQDSHTPMVLSNSKIVKTLNTPSTAATADQSSFWSEQLGISPVPLGPFSPDAKRQRTEVQ